MTVTARPTGMSCPICGWPTTWIAEWGEDDDGEEHYEPHAGEECGQCGWESR